MIELLAHHTSTMMLLLQQAVADPSWLEPLLAAITAVLGIPIVYSFVTGLFRRVATTVDPRVLLGIVSLVGTGLGYYSTGIDLPTFDGGAPLDYMAAWLLIAGGFHASAKVLYDMLLNRFPIFNPPAPTP